MMHAIRMGLNLALLFLVAAYGTFAGAQERGGPAYPTAQDGLWSVGSTWVGGVTPTDGATGQAQIAHTVQAASAGQTSGTINVGYSAGAGVLNITAGDLTINSITVGFANPGVVNLSGGTLTVISSLSLLTSGSAFNVSGGTFSAPAGSFAQITLNSNVSMRIVGGSASISVDNTSVGNALTFSDNTTLTIEPTANGAAGLTTINLVDGSVDISTTNTTLELDTSSYTPQVGDSWDIITYVDSITGGFSTLTAPAGFTIIEDQSTPGIVTITVTAAPAPSLSVADYWGLAVLGSLLLAVAALVLTRNKRHRVAIG